MFGCCACCTSDHKIGHADPCPKHQRAEGGAADKAWKALSVTDKIKAASGPWPPPGYVERVD